MAARVALLVALVVGTLVGAIYLRQAGPEGLGVFGGCRLREATGYYCPGCGGTRAMHALLYFRWGDALAYNPLVFVVVALFLVLALVIARELLGERYRGPVVRFPAFLAWGLVVLAVVFGIVRNIPTWPFTLLTP